MVDDSIILNSELYQYLSDLYNRYFLRESIRQYQDFRDDEYLSLKQYIHNYFDGTPRTNPVIREPLFNIIAGNFARVYRTIKWRDDAQLLWSDILSIVMDWESKSGSRIHKGSIYYFWAYEAIEQGQLDKGFYLIHSAYIEDAKTHETPTPPTPAYLTVSLNYMDEKNLLFSLVVKWANYLDQYINQYQKSTGMLLDLSTFRSKFMENPPNRDLTISFVYTLARFYSFDELPQFLAKGEFVSIYEANALYDLVLVIDNLIHFRISTSKKHEVFRYLANLWLNGLGITKRTEKHLGEINDSQIKNFDLTLTELLDRTFIYPSDKKVAIELECEIGLVYCIRNRYAHNISSSFVMMNRFDEIRQTVFNVLFRTIEGFL